MSFEVNGIYVINLDSRPERWELFEKDARLWEKAYGCVPDRYPAIQGVNLPGYGDKPWFRPRQSEKRKRSWGGKAGCVLSHRNVIYKANQQKFDKVLVLEDDASIDSANVQVWLSGLKELVEKLPEDWVTINFCTAMPISPCRLVGEFDGFRLIETCGAFSTVAYLMNGRFLGQILEELPDEGSIWSWVARHKTIDRWYSQNLMRFGKVYLVAPALIGHRSVGSSDISMSAELDWTLDFSLNHQNTIDGIIKFNVLRAIRKYENLLRCKLSFFRLIVKEYRGL